MSIKLSNVQISYSGSPRPVLNIDSLEFKNTINFITGINGSGKSTLLKALSNINDEVILKGDIELDGKKLSEFNIGLVTQSPLASINLDLTFLENLLLASTNGYTHLSLLPQLTSSSSRKIVDFLQTFKSLSFVPELLYKGARSMSAGQQQMLAILMRVIRFQKLLLLDECTANLDANNTKIIIYILRELAEKGTIILFATHQEELLRTVKSVSFRIDNGGIKVNKNEKNTN
jgi:ABC-type bacteriocin/lantibiotic exporter with double-glycine peptidase domain